jgi:hypothetical protein
VPILEGKIILVEVTESTKNLVNRLQVQRAYDELKALTDALQHAKNQVDNSPDIPFSRRSLFCRIMRNPCWRAISVLAVLSIGLITVTLTIYFALQKAKNE